MKKIVLASMFLAAATAAYADINDYPERVVQQIQKQACEGKETVDSKYKQDYGSFRYYACLYAQSPEEIENVVDAVIVEEEGLQAGNCDPLLENYLKAYPLAAKSFGQKILDLGIPYKMEDEHYTPVDIARWLKSVLIEIRLGDQALKEAQK